MTIMSRPILPSKGSILHRGAEIGRRSSLSETLKGVADCRVLEYDRGIRPVTP